MDTHLAQYAREASEAPYVRQWRRISAGIRFHTRPGCAVGAGVSLIAVHVYLTQVPLVRTDHGTADPGFPTVPFWRGCSDSLSEDGLCVSFAFSFLYAMKADAPFPLARRSMLA